MQFLVGRCIEKLDLRNSKTLNPIKWWKKNKAYAILLVILVLLDIPKYLLVQLMKIICFIPYAIYEKLDEFY